MPFEYPRDVAAALLRSIEEGATNLLADGSVAPVPSLREVEELLDVTFTATLYEEEGRRVRFRLAFVSADGAVNSQLVVFPFRERALFTARVIAKLAPSMDPANAYLGIEAGSDGALWVWGIIHRGLDREHLPPYFLTVTAVKPGSFAVEFFGQSKLFYSRGQTYLHKANPQHLMFGTTDARGRKITKDQALRIIRSAGP